MTKTMDAEILALAEAQAAKDRELMASLTARSAAAKAAREAQAEVLDTAGGVEVEAREYTPAEIADMKASTDRWIAELSVLNRERHNRRCWRALTKKGVGWIKWPRRHRNVIAPFDARMLAFFCQCSRGSSAMRSV